MIFAEVVKQGPLTTVQDLGRPDFTSVGVPIGGAMDPYALRAANLALGNEAGAAGLEITLQRLELVITAPTTLCLGGAPRATLGEGELPNYTPFVVRKGDRLSLSPGDGARAYLACTGGISVPLVLGSASTFLPAAFGGFEGRALRAGDRLRGGAKSAKSKSAKAKSPVTAKRLSKAARYREAQDRLLVRYIAHGDGESLDMLERAWTVDPRSDRMGVRLKGNASRSSATGPTPGALLSQGAFFGLIQLPPDGNPILLGADAQTIGGYAIAGTVILADLWKIGQLLPGDTIRLEGISQKRAQMQWRDQERALKASAPSSRILG